MTRKGNVLGIEQLVFDESKFEGQKICRLKERIMLLVVHKSIKEAIEEASLTGFMFVSDDEYCPSML